MTSFTCNNTCNCRMIFPVSYLTVYMQTAFTHFIDNRIDIDVDNKGFNR